MAHGPNPRMVPWHGADRAGFDRARDELHEMMRTAAMVATGEWTPPKAKSVLVPTVNLANLVYRAVRKGRTPYNYCAAIRDASGGIYIQLGWADWVRPGDTYINPHTRT